MLNRLDLDLPAPERVPPHNIECEQALLGALLMHNQSFGEIVGSLKPAHFFEPLHGRLFELISKQIEEGKPSDPITLKLAVANEPPIGELSVAQYLGRLVAAATTFINVKFYAEKIRELADRRDMIIAAERLIDDAYSADEPILDAASKAMDCMTNIVVNPSGRKTSELIGDTAQSVMIDLSDLSPPDNIISTKLTDLDRLLGGGFIDGDLIVVGGRPSMGKTTLGHAIAMNICRSDPANGVIYFSLEMMKEIMAKRALSSLCYNRDRPIPYQDIIAKKVPAELFYRFERPLEILKQMHLLIDDQPALTMAQIAARSRIIKAAWARKGINLRAIFADHMLLVKGDGSYKGQKRHEVGDIYKAAKALGKELEVPFVALHQVKRLDGGRDDKRPDMDDLGEAGSIEQDADVILFPYREAYQHRKKRDDPDEEAQRLETLAEVEHDMEVFAAKNKNGPVSTVTLWCSMPDNAVRNMVRA